MAPPPLSDKETNFQKLLYLTQHSIARQLIWFRYLIIGLFSYFIKVKSRHDFLKTFLKIIWYVPLCGLGHRYSGFSHLLCLYLTKTRGKWVFSFFFSLNQCLLIIMKTVTTPALTQTYYVIFYHFKYWFQWCLKQGMVGGKHRVFAESLLLVQLFN